MHYPLGKKIIQFLKQAVTLGLDNSNLSNLDLNISKKAKKMMKFLS